MLELHPLLLLSNPMGRPLSAHESNDSVQSWIEQGDLEQRETSVSLKDVLALGKFKPGSAPACTLMCVYGELDPGLNNEA